MTLDAEQRRQREALRRQIKVLEGPETKAKADLRRKNRRERVKAIGKPAQGQRQPRERDPGYLAFLRRLPCFAGVMGHRADCEGATQAAHLRFSDAAKGRRNPGMAAKSHDRFATPLCAGHHLRDQHAGEERAFWNRLGVDPGDLSNALHTAYLAGEDGAAVLRRFVPSEQS